MDEKNLHQQKKELLKQLNFWWHNPKVTSATQAEVLQKLKECLEMLKGVDTL